MTVYSVKAEAELPWRFGFIVSKAVGNAVTRNRVRRRLKAICHTMTASDVAAPAFDVVFRAHAPAASASFSELEQQAVALVARSVARSGAGAAGKEHR